MNQAFIRAVNDRLLFTTSPKHTDAAILLGARSVSGEIAKHAMKGIASGHFNKVILCGGNRVFEPWIHGVLFLKGLTNISASDFWSREREADYMARILEDKKAEIIFLENTSKHTGETFQNIRDYILASDIKSAAIYTTAYHQLRAQETCRRWIPELDTTTVPVYPFGLSRETWLKEWHKTPIIRGIIRDEYEKLNPNNPNNYYNLGYCTPS
jgi:uncharacterized SAM-binding protein YcdF (DUF218 family)